MIKTKLIYLILIAAAALFYVLFIDSMSLIILILTAAFPFIQLFILFRISKNITAVLDTDEHTLPKNTDTRIIVTLKNYSVFPVSSAVAELDIVNTLTGEKQSLTTMLPVSADNEQVIKFCVSFAHCGKVNVTLRSIRIYDYIRLFSHTITFNTSKDIIIVPSLVTISPAVETTLTGISENNEFSKIKPGDDCTEIFNIREYAYGDKINRIHWNLTTKLDNLMVKEYSMPVSNRIMIVFEFCINNDSYDRFYKNDAVIETAMSLSHFMIKNNISHQICWFDPRKKLFHTDTISSEDDFSAFIGSVFLSGTYPDYYSAFTHHKVENIDKKYSHTIYISPVLVDEIFHNFSVLHNTQKATYVHITDNFTEEPEFFKSTEKSATVTVRYGSISEGLNKILI